MKAAVVGLLQQFKMRPACAHFNVPLLTAAMWPALPHLRSRAFTRDRTRAATQRMVRNCLIFIYRVEAQKTKLLA